jgi:hypothetical protein
MRARTSEAEVMEYLWPRMGERRKAALVKYLIHGDHGSAKRLLDDVRLRGQQAPRVAKS